jgi:hypothetical protein
MLSLRVVVRKGGILGVSGAFGSEALRTDNDTSKNKHCRQALLATPPHHAVLRGKQALALCRQALRVRLFALAVSWGHGRKRKEYWK